MEILITPLFRISEGAVLMDRDGTTTLYVRDDLSAHRVGILQAQAILQFRSLRTDEAILGFLLHSEYGVLAVFSVRRDGEMFIA